MAPSAEYNSVRDAAGAEPAEFLTAIWGTPPPGKVLVWTLPDKRSHWYAHFDSIDADMRFHAHEDVYTGVGIAPKDGVQLTSSKRLKEFMVVGIPAFWADLDVAHPVHKKAERLPKTREEALEALGELPMEPTLIIDSGHGLQCWWILDQPWMFETPEEREQARRATQWWHRMIQDAFRKRGWVVDSTFDLARVMRIPGLLNNKDPEDRREVTLLEDRKHRYGRNLFLELVPANFQATAMETGRIRSNTPREKGGGNGNGDSQPQSSGHILDPDAEPSFTRMETLLKLDPKFRKTWEKDRPDLQDQSASSYDMALANAAVRAEWPDQEVVNLLIAFRRTHGFDLKLREDYYALTIGKAKEPYPRSGDDLADDGGSHHNNRSNSQAGPSAEGAPPDLAGLLRTVKGVIHECKDPEAFRLIHEINLLASAWSDATDPGKRAAAQIQAHYDVYADHGDVPTLEALAAAVKSAMSPATQVPILVDRVVTALLGNQKSAEPLAELMAMLRRQAALEGNRAELMTLEEAADLPVPRSLLRAKGMSGSVLDVGEVMVLSGMGGVGKSTATLGWALDMALLGKGNRGKVGGIFEGEGGPVLMVSYEEQAAVMGDKALVWVKHLDKGDPNGRYHAARQHVIHLGIRNPIFGPDPYTPLYNARPTRLEGWDEVAEAAEKIEPVFIMIDPALCAFVADASNPAAVSEFLMTMKDLAGLIQGGVILVTHNTKAARGSGGRRAQDGADPGQVLGAGAWTDRSRSAMTLTTDSKGCPQLTIAKANRGPQRIYIGLDPVFDDKKRLLGYKVEDQATWKRLDQQSDGGAGRGSGPQPGNSKKPSQTKGLFED